jgi:hypothetical protein
VDAVSSVFGIEFAVPAGLATVLLLALAARRVRGTRVASSAGSVVAATPRIEALADVEEKPMTHQAMVGTGTRGRARLGLALAIAVCASSYACGDEANESAEAAAGAGCPPGVICGDVTSSGAGAAGSAGTGAGAGSSGTGNGTGTATGGCVEAWECSPWETNGTNDDGYRTCVDKNACGTEMTKPVVAATLPPLDIELYKCEIEPIWDRSCSMMGCHGTDARGLRVYSRGRYRAANDLQGQPIMITESCGPKPAFPITDCIGSIECACFIMPHTPTEWRRNYDASRGLALGADGQLLGDMEQSALLQEPMEGGSRPHAGYKLFGAADAEHATIVSWLQGGTFGATCDTTN